jgi:hypothetical protein
MSSTHPVLLVRSNASRLAGGLGAAALATFTAFFWADALASRFAGGLVIALSTLAIAVFAATGSRLAVQARTALFTSLVWWLLLVLVASVVTLAKFGSFEEGGPYGLALVVGIYQGLPIAVLAVISAGLVGRLLSDER